MVIINGENADAAGMTVTEYLDKAGYDVRVVVVEKNEEIVPKSEYPDTVLKDNDVIEIVAFMGGGSTKRQKGMTK
jgi:thiamine biosynthesis protein ThiS